MDGLLIKHIPQVLLARILVQLYIIPQQAIKSPQFNLLSVLVAGLRDYGQGEDLDGFFSFCTRQSFDSLAGDTSLTPSSWLWKDYTLHQVGDWDLIGHDQLQDASEPSTPLIGLRVQLASEKVKSICQKSVLTMLCLGAHSDRINTIWEETGRFARRPTDVYLRGKGGRRMIERSDKIANLLACFIPGAAYICGRRTGSRVGIHVKAEWWRAVIINYNTIIKCDNPAERATCTAEKISTNIRWLVTIGNWFCPDGCTYGQTRRPTNTGSHAVWLVPLSSGLHGGRYRIYLADTQRRAREGWRRNTGKERDPNISNSQLFSAAMVIDIVLSSIGRSPWH